MLSTIRPIRIHATALTNPYFPDMPTQLPKLTKDFHLDTFFNPTWMAGPHVFSFSESGTVIRPKAISPNPYPLSSSAPKISRAPVSIRSYAEAVKASQFHGLSTEEKPWKNVAITEQDDAEFEALMAIASQQQQTQMDANKNGKLECSWPPDLSAHQQMNDSARDEEGHYVDENDAPLSLYVASPVTSQESERDSPMIPTPGKRKDRVPFRILHERSASFESESSPTLEKATGFERLKRKAPPPLQLDLLNVEDTSPLLFGSIEVTNESEDGNEFMEKQQLSPLTAGINLDSKALCKLASCQRSLN